MNGRCIFQTELAQRGVELQPLVDALKRDILGRRVVHADETPVQMLQPGKGKTHRAYLWAYVWAYVWAHSAGAYENIKAVACDFCESRAAANVKANQTKPTAIGRNWQDQETLDTLIDQLQAGRVTHKQALMQARKLEATTPNNLETHNFIANRLWALGLQDEAAEV
jgi:hypothetical protein